MSTTPKPFRLETVLELAQKDTEHASREVGRLQHHRNEADDKLATLAAYRENYYEQLMQSGGQGVDVTRLRNYAAFIDRLGSAIHQQRGTVQALDARLEESREVWLERQRREKSFDILKQRFIAEQKREAERKAQRENDEHAMKLLRARAAQRRPEAED
jgi:flagellar FliJ protein